MWRLKFVPERQWPVIVNITATYRHNIFYLYKDRGNETGRDWVFTSPGTWEQSRRSSRPRYSHSHLQEDVSSICWGAQFLSGFVCCYMNSSIVVFPSIMMSLDMDSLLLLLWVWSPWWFGICLASRASYERESKGWLFDEATHRAIVGALWSNCFFVQVTFAASADSSTSS